MTRFPWRICKLQNTHTTAKHTIQVKVSKSRFLPPNYIILFGLFFLELLFYAKQNKKLSNIILSEKCFFMISKSGINKFPQIKIEDFFDF